MKTIELYEWLARWRDGQLSGYHVQLLEKHTDDTTGEVLAEKISTALTPVQAEALGFSLSDILDKFNIDALRKIAEHEATIAEKTASVADKDAAIATAASEKAAELAVKDAELASKVTELAVKTTEIAAENAVAAAAKALAAKIAEVAAAEKDDPEREKKEAEAAQLAAQVAAKDAELAFVKLPEKEQREQKLRDEIARLQAKLEEGKY